MFRVHVLKKTKTIKHVIKISILYNTVLLYKQMEKLKALLVFGVPGEGKTHDL